MAITVANTPLPTGFQHFSGVSEGQWQVDMLFSP